MKVRKAIIPAAGLGTRFLPATKAQPKEMLPIVDKPTIQYIIEEAVESGIEEILIITGRNKKSIKLLENHEFRSKIKELITEKVEIRNIVDYYNAFEEANNLKINYKIMERRSGDIAECYANCDKANRELNWVAKYTVLDACKDSWNWQSKNPNGYED